MVTEDDLTLGSRPTIQIIECALQTYMTLLTKVTLINLI